MKVEYPSHPEPHTVELEITNHCNAACQFCPHPRMTRERGFMDLEPFKKLLEELAEYRKKMWLNTRAGKELFPRIVFAGLGDPTIHPDLYQFVSLAREWAFDVQVVTNGLLLTPKLVHKLREVGVSSIAFSLHTLDPEIYRRLMRLDLRKTLPNIRHALEVFKDTDTRLELWRVLPPPGQPRESSAAAAQFDSLVSEFPHVTVLGPSEPWERDGTVPNSVWSLVHDSDEVWCHKLFFTSNIAWDGRAVICCVDFHKIAVEMGNVFEEGFLAVQEKRIRLFESGEQVNFCKSCRRWKDTEYQDSIYPKLLGIRSRKAAN